MRQVLLIAAALGLSVTGCDFISGLTGGGTTTTTTTDPSATAIPVPAPGDSPVAGQPSPGQPDAATAEPKGILPPDLISSTDPNQRVQQVKGTRNDPFALLPTTPSVQLPPNTSTAGGIAPGAVSPGSVGGGSPGSVGGGARAGGGTGGGRTPNRPSTSTASNPSRAGGGASGGSTAAKPKAPAPAPRSPITAPVPRPDPVLAKAVEVTGVVQIGNQAFAIVNAPNEPTSRYVQEGQRLAGGQVLVRRIDFNRAEPVVILEQSGVEVVRAVGESGTIALPTAGVPAT
ncbi:MAG: hypothetical protein KME07_10295 [Pegethrix bostrychoides GSE-TBD4-15B]|jgi:hypothetical protein|uniref:Uncharacterized protein n=1 Tax=Pegethrix bostrychoides GSE-TBD4-15B TaxID=2839662 RepID=A0A951U5S6_9CYAN|nr:hypothetical protein [Pegethrix bostrychoides GSE-TBD4-15B]